MTTGPEIFDEELMSRFIKNNDESAFKSLVNRHTTRMYRIACAMLGSSRNAEDAVQECFIRIVFRRRTFQDGTTFAPWAYTILRNLCIDEIRKNKGRYFEVLSHETIASKDDSGVYVEEKEKIKAVRNAIKELPEIEQTAITLRIYGEMDFNAIATICKTSPDAIKKRFYRALEELKKSLSLFE